MFELPTNNTQQVRENVVNRLVEALYKKKHLNYCDDKVSIDGEARLSSYFDEYNQNDKRTYVSFSIDERKKAFEIFKDKGYHISRITWPSARGEMLWSYELKERKEGEEDRNFTWIF